MFTVCPKCDLALAITAQDLRAAQGHVRCGRCQNVFNALESLTDEHPHSPPYPITARTPDTSPDVGQEAGSTHADPESTVEVAAVTVADEAPLTEPELSVEQEAILMAGAEQPMPEPAEPAEPAPETSLLAESEPPRARVGWTVGAALLALALALQGMNHYRDSLATVPAFAGPLRTVYAALGVDLTPDWDVHAYDARQLGATMGGADHEITVRASIANLAQQAQPLPLLRVILQDRFGRPVAARDVEPRAYLRTLPTPPLLPPGGRVDASATFISPGPQVVGFEIDACLRRDGTVVCAHGS